MRCPRALGAALLGVLILGGSSALGAHQLAFSKSMGVTVFAEGEPKWCDRQLRLTIDADSADFFQSPELAKLVRVLGTKVLAAECSLADAAELGGRHQGVTVWKGNARKDDGWAVQTRAPEEASTDVAAAGQGAPDDDVADAVAETASATAGVATATEATIPAEGPVRQAPVEITQDPSGSPPVESEAAANAAPMATAGFAVNGWTPVPVLRHEEDKLDSVANKDQTCSIHYTVRPNDKGLVYLESDLPCVDGWIDGDGKASIKRIDGKQIAQMKGNFRRGFFTGDDTFDPDSIVGIDAEDPSGMLVLLKSDNDLKAHYLGNVAAIGANRWGFCYYAQVRILTEDQNLFLNEEMIDLVVKNAADLVSQLCPKQRRFRFSAGSSPWDFDKRDHSVSYYVTQVHQDRRSKRWSFNKTRAWNGVIAARIAKAEEERLEQQRKEREAELARQAAERQARQEEYRRQQEQQRAEREAQAARLAAERKAKQEEYQRQLEQQRAERAALAKAYQEQQAKLNRWRQAKSDYDRVTNLDGVGRLAYLANTAAPRFPLDLYAEHVVSGQAVSGAVLVRVSDHESDYSEVDWPVAMRLEDNVEAIDDEGVYFVIGRVTGGEQRDDTLPLVRMEVERAWLCKERLCDDHGDVLTMVRARHDYPDFDPEQQPEQPTWQ